MLVWQPGVRVGIGWALSTVLLVSTMSLRLFAQPPASRGPVFAARSDLVLIPMHVTDRAGKTITDLRSDQFEVLEEEESRDIVSFSKEDGPVSLGFVIDLSGSMNGLLARVVAALHAIADAAETGDEMFLLACASQPRLLVDFTTDVSRLTSSLTFSRADGSTALIDSIYLALNQVRKGAHKRRALVVVSDGGDSHSPYRFSELMAAAVEADTQIYTIALPARVRRHGIPDILERLSFATGGLHFVLRHERELSAASAEVGTALRNVYVIGFRPREHSGGNWRRVQVRLQPELRPFMRISARSGYFVPE